jgi:hypothetical protein
MLQISRRLRSNPKPVHEGKDTPIHCREAKPSCERAKPDGPATQLRQCLPGELTIVGAPGH